MTKKSTVLWELVLTIVIVITVIEIYNNTKPKHPYVGLDIEELIHEYGYPVETHELVTEDGYILTLHRIPHGRGQTPQKRVPVLIMHGFVQSATDFVNLGPERSLSFLLADKGYDVWLGNVRGTTWSKRHKTFDSDTDREYWDFSLHEIGIYDVPACIDYILEVTQYQSLHYVGYSQGTSTFFILGSEKPQYMSKIRLMTALAPAVFMKDPKGPFLGALVYFRRASEFFLELFQFRDFLSENSVISMYLKQICSEHSLLVDVCMHHIFQLHGYDPEELNKTELSLIFANTPSGVAPKQMMHIVQLLESGEFHRYDLGVEQNLEEYGQEEPPFYNTTKVVAPVALYYGNNDHIINVKNIDRLVEALPNVVRSYEVLRQLFNHYDFINAKNVVSLLYDDVIENIEKY